MTKYEYYDQLQEVCFRAVKALSVTEKENQTLIDFYSAAEEGFFRKKESLKIKEALELINQNQKDRLNHRKAWLEEIEYQAAIKQREEQDESNNSDSF